MAKLRSKKKIENHDFFDEYPREVCMWARTMYNVYIYIILAFNYKFVDNINTKNAYRPRYYLRILTAKISRNFNNGITTYSCIII